MVKYTKVERKVCTQAMRAMLATGTFLPQRWSGTELAKRMDIKSTEPGVPLAIGIRKLSEDDDSPLIMEQFRGTLWFTLKPDWTVEEVNEFIDEFEPQSE